MVKITATYEGDLRCRATHGPSGNSLHTDAPVDNEGKGESFSPTDLLATALTTCIMTICGIMGRRHGLDLSGMRAEVEKGMVADPLRRVGSLPVTVTIPGQLSADDRERLERAAHTCPVHRSIHPDIDAPIHFVYPDLA